MTKNVTKKRYSKEKRKQLRKKKQERRALLVMCSFSKTEIPVKFPAGFDRSKAKLVLQSYPEVKDKLQPYEARVYLWE